MLRSRTKNVTLNMTIALACQFVNLLVSFVSRTIFIKLMGTDYLGVSGLFGNILSILSFAELGIGGAIVYNMYKPLAVGDEEKLCSLMALYKKAYAIIGAVIAIIGVSLTPFLQFIIKDPPKIDDNLQIIYLLFLTSTVSSYFLVYKRSIISADQRNYILTISGECIFAATVVSQIIILFLTRNYIAYLITNISFSILGNVIAAIIADKLYPFLKKKAIPLSKDETKQIFKNVNALTIYKLAGVILGGTSNILISAFIGIKEVGLVSNYTLLSSSCGGILSRITGAFSASVGNLNAVGDDKKKYEIFNILLFISAWLYGFASVGLIIVSPLFIETWIGSEFILDNITVIAIIFGFYDSGVSFAIYLYRTTLGYFVQGKIAPILATILNIILAILLINLIGLPGIFIAKSIAIRLTFRIVDPYLIYKNTFNVNPLVYHIKFFSYLTLTIAIGLLCRYAISFINATGWVNVIMQIIIVTIIFNGIMLIIFHRTKVFKELMGYVFSLIRKEKRG